MGARLITTGAATRCMLGFVRLSLISRGSERSSVWLLRSLFRCVLGLSWNGQQQRDQREPRDERTGHSNLPWLPSSETRRAPKRSSALFATRFFAPCGGTLSTPSTTVTNQSLQRVLSRIVAHHNYGAFRLNQGLGRRPKSSRNVQANRTFLPTEA